PWGRRATLAPEPLFNPVAPGKGSLHIADIGAQRREARQIIGVCLRREGNLLFSEPQHFDDVERLPDRRLKLFLHGPDHLPPLPGMFPRQDIPVLLIEEPRQGAHVRSDEDVRRVRWPVRSVSQSLVCDAPLEVLLLSVRNDVVLHAAVWGLSSIAAE